MTKSILALVIFSACYVEPAPTPGPGPGPSGDSYYECDTYVQCADGRYTSTLYTGCAQSATAAVNGTISQCVADYAYTCGGGGVYCETTCRGGVNSCRAEDAGLLFSVDVGEALSD